MSGSGISSHPTKTGSKLRLKKLFRCRDRELHLIQARGNHDLGAQHASTSVYPDLAALSTRQHSVLRFCPPLPLPVAQRGLVIIPKSQSQKAQIRTPSPPAPNTRLCACALSRSPASLKNPPPPIPHAAPRLSQISDLPTFLPIFQLFTRHRTLRSVPLLKPRI